MQAATLVLGLKEVLGHLYFQRIPSEGELLWLGTRTLRVSSVVHPAYIEVNHGHACYMPSGPPIVFVEDITEDMEETSAALHWITKPQRG